MAGGRIDVEVAVNGRDAPGQLQRAMQPAMIQAKQFGAAMGLAIGGATIAAGVKEIISIGNDYTVTMNTLQAVSGATAEQLAAAGQRAKELGNDISLPGTSANDAAAAMTELAKGGFSVQESMDAAKGTLQMAAAAQIDAASAATIQSQALQSFGLNADYAAKVSDVLANAANASSAEITDVASGLQQSGAVANQFGLSIEDTAATLGLLANAGIQGSDAGTLLKSTLLALTDQSNPAQGAIEELGLTVYNAQGQFVGMSELFGQLDAAAASMSPELYQAATATLFGSDAMRLAGVAAEQGREGYDSMREAVDRQGAAAEVAAAKVQGLPGAMASVQNAAETLALDIYDLVDGPMEGLATKGADFITNVTPGIISGFSTIGSTLEPVAGLVGDVASAFADLPGPVQAVALAFGAIKLTGLDDSIGTTINGWRESISQFRDEVQGEIDMQSALAGISDADTSNPFNSLTDGADDLAGALEENAEPISELAAGLATLERRHPAIRNMAEGYRGVTARTREFANEQRAAAGNSGVLGSALRNATARASEFGGVVGGAAVAGVRGLRTAASGAIGMLGGPWMAGIMAASFAVSGITGAIQSANRQQEIIEESSSAVADAQRDMAKAFQESKGAVDDNVMNALAMQLDAVSQKQEQLAEDSPGFWAGLVAGAKNIPSLFTGDGMAGQEWLDEQNANFEAAENVKAKLEELGFTNEDLGNKISGTDLAWAQFVSTLRDGTQAGEDTVAAYQPLRDEFVELQRSAATLTPGFSDLSRAVDVLADSSSSADDRLDALKDALDVLMGRQIPLSDAVADYNAAINDITGSSADAIDKTKGFGDQLIGADGAVNTLTANGGALRDRLLEIKDASLTAADAAARDALAHGQTMPEAQDAAVSAINRNREALEKLASDYGVPIDAMQRMIEQEGLINKNVRMLVSLQGADETYQSLVEVQGLISQVPPGVPIEMKIDDEQARANLATLGFNVQTLPNGNVEVIAKNALALTALQEVIDRTAEVGASSATPKIGLDDTGFRLGVGQSRAELEAIDLSTADPRIGAVITDLLAGRDVSLAALNALDTTTASPEVILAIQRALADADVVDKELDRIANKQRIANISARVASGETSFGAAFTEAFPPVPRRATGGANIPNGALRGPGTGKSDSMLMYSPGFGYWRGSNGEHVLTEEDVQAMGGHDNVYRFRNMLHSNSAEDLMKGLPGFAEGGALDRVRDVGQRANGNPYVWGGADISGADCSGFVAILQRAAMGQGESGRLGTTYSLLAGEWPGLVPGTQGPFVVGTSEEHMAATIAGVNYESGGANNGITVGGSAAGAFDSQFTSQYYLPWELFAPPYDPASGAASGMTGLESANTYTTSGGYSSKRKATWAEKDDLALESARVAITQAEEDLQAALNNPKKSAADKDQARIKVERAKQKVKDLEAKKDAAAKGLDAPPAPDAPELTTNYSDEQLSALDAEAAVEEARLKRNEVYADPESTPEDKAAADRALQRARNALTKQKSGGSDSETGAFTTADQWSSAIGGVIGDFFTENIADVLGYYEADNMGPLAKAGIAAITGVAQMQKDHLEENAKLLDTAKPATQEELANQLPTTPGTPDWIQLLESGLLKQAPVKLFDNGGVWKSGTFGLNMSGQDEEVLTGSMRRSVAQELALSRAARLTPAASSPGRSDARPITVNNNGYDRREVAAGIRQARHEDEWFSRATRIGES